MTRRVTLLAIALTLGCQPTPQPSGTATPGETCEPQTMNPEPMPVTDVSVCETLVQPRKAPVEFVGLQVSKLTTLEEFTAFLDGIYGADVATGGGHDDYEIQEGLLLSVTPDDASGEQVIVELDMATFFKREEVPRRTILRVPASYAYGAIFRDTVVAALTRAQAVYEANPEESEPFYLEHRLRSQQGGAVDIRLRYEAGLAYLELQTHTPRTSLSTGKVNDPAFEGQPYETIAGEVNFHLTLDQFEFFSTRAYGITAGKNQNFNDFELSPHNWLRLTVEPKLADELVEVGFEVVTNDDRRLALAKAPASLLAGDQFRQNVIRMHRNMDRQMEAEGTSSAFKVPYYYDAPDGGGVVQVIAQGKDGEFSIAYAVESPVNFLKDAEFVGYQGKIEVPDTLEAPMMSCADVGSEEALEGQLVITFDAASPVRTSSKLKAELRGNVWGSVFRASDVSGLGPREGAQSVASFQFDGVDLTDPNNLQSYVVETPLPVGEYQILGFIDIDANADPMDADPDSGDPVTLPIGSYEVKCARQPVTVEFAILRP